MRHVRERREGGGDRTRAGEEERGGAGWCGASRACAWLWLARGRAVVEEVRGATEGERIVSGLLPEEFEEVDRLAMGEDVQQALLFYTTTARFLA